MQGRNLINVKNFFYSNQRRNPNQYYVNEPESSVYESQQSNYIQQFNQPLKLLENQVNELSLQNPNYQQQQLQNPNVFRGNQHVNFDPFTRPKEKEESIIPINALYPFKTKTNNGFENLMKINANNHIQQKKIDNNIIYKKHFTNFFNNIKNGDILQKALNYIVTLDKPAIMLQKYINNGQFEKYFNVLFTYIYIYLDYLKEKQTSLKEKNKYFEFVNKIFNDIKIEGNNDEFNKNKELNNIPYFDEFIKINNININKKTNNEIISIIKTFLNLLKKQLNIDDNNLEIKNLEIEFEKIENLLEEIKFDNFKKYLKEEGEKIEEEGEEEVPVV